ncbi:MAG: hypothetical protein KC496_20370 [Anaerolineae bacterium]|nr:hypothetical protein [Anaerolineae bacterium]
MAKTTVKPDNPEAFERLMRLGNVSRAQGDHRLAHEYWREAAMLQPERVEVWKALLNILETDEDRRVCLQNILALEPDNRPAKQQLAALLESTTTETAEHPRPAKLPLVRPQAQQKVQRWYGKALQYTLEILLVVLITLALLNLETVIHFVQTAWQSLIGML